MTIEMPVALVILMNKTFLELFHDGGLIMWPILVLSLVAVTVVSERVLFAMRENRARDAEVIEKMLEKVEAGDVDGAMELGKQSNDYIARIMIYALSHRETSLSNAFVRSSNQELTRFGQGLPTLETCITAAPLLGLLGTVTGMMRTFGNMQGDIAAAASQITGGVAEALIATACGLLIAVCCLMPYNYLNARWERARHEVEDAGNALDIILKKTGQHNASHEA